MPGLGASELAIQPLSAESSSFAEKEVQPSAPAASTAVPVNGSASAASVAVAEAVQVEAPASKARVAAAVEPVPSTAIAPAMPAVTAPPAHWAGTQEIRTLPLRVPLNAPVLPFDGAAQDWTVSERYRMIRTRILHHPRQPRVMVVSSPGSGDGKSVTAVNVAGALSLKASAKVLLMDADFRRPTIYKQTGLPNDPGLAAVLEKQCSLEQALVHTLQFPNLYVLPAGEGNLNPAELLDSAEWHRFCATIREMFAYVIIDSPPIAAVADYELIQARCDGVILVARPDHTNRAACFRSLELIPPDKMIGVVVNCVEDWFLAKALRQETYYYTEYKR